MSADNGSGGVERYRWACLECDFETNDLTNMQSHVLSEHVRTHEYYTDTGYRRERQSLENQIEGREEANDG